MRSLLLATALCAAALTFSGCSFTACGPCNSLSHQSTPSSCGCQDAACQDASCQQTACQQTACQDAACQECSTCSPKKLIGSWKGQPECSGVNFGEGAPCGMENVVMAKPAKKGLFCRLGGIGTKRTAADCGCGIVPCGCDTTTVVAPTPVAPSISDCGCQPGACDGRCGLAQRRAQAKARNRADLGMTIFDRGSECKPDCGGNCGGACGTGMVSTKNGLLDRAFANRQMARVDRGSKCGPDCGGNCGGACGAAAPVSAQGGLLSRTGLFDRGSKCGPECPGNCGGACGATVSTQGGLLDRSRANRASTSAMQSGMTSRMQRNNGRGCGRFGCGRDGKLCLTCSARSGLLAGDGNAGCASGNCGRCGSCRQKGRPYAGEIPHTAPTPGMTGQVPQYIYPYYTTRGPRDFLMANPPTIGY